MHDRTLEELWNSAPPARRHFDPAMVERLPPVVRRLFLHAFARDARLAIAARIRMHGTIRLEGAWNPFEAEQVLRWDRGFVWHAKARMKGLPVSGFDRWVDGVGAMRWKAFGLAPVMSADGPDISRSAAGRLQIESVWLPAVLLDPAVEWSARDDTHAIAIVRAHGEETHLAFEVDGTGRVRSLHASRWSNAGGGEYREQDFGGVVLADRAFDGITIASELRVGWWFGTPRFEAEGEFFRATVDDVQWR
jgi:hypothetical protein